MPLTAERASAGRAPRENHAKTHEKLAHNDAHNYTWG